MKHDFVGYKCSQEPFRLAERDVARDLLLRVFLKDGFCIAVFRFGAVALPEDLAPELETLVGKEAACFLSDGIFHLREGL